MALCLLVLHYGRAWDLLLCWVVSLSESFLFLLGGINYIIEMKHVSIIGFRNIPYYFLRDTSKSSRNV